MKNARAHVIIYGYVQGVCFRSETTGEARSKGLFGQVWNNADGTVEAVIEGAEDAVKEMVDWCRRGPTSARVDRVEVSWEDYLNEHQDFSTTFPPSKW